MVVTIVFTPLPPPKAETLESLTKVSEKAALQPLKRPCVEPF